MMWKSLVVTVNRIAPISLLCTSTCPRFASTDLSALHIQIVRAKEVLGLDSSTPDRVSHTQLRNAYYSLAKKCHPDSAEEKNKDPVRFHKLAEAYELLSGKTKHLDNMEQSTVQVSNHANHLWAKLFYGSIEDEIFIDRQTVRDIENTAQMSSGGLDKGGMWRLVDEMNRNLAEKSNSDSVSLGGHLESDSLSTEGSGSSCGSLSLAKPFTRRKRK